MSIIIKPLFDTTVPLSDVVDLLHVVFADRVKQGMNFGAAVITEQELKKEISEGAAFVAIDTNCSKLVGFGIIKIKTEGSVLFGYLAHEAVDSSYQGMGIATELLKVQEKYAKEKGCSYIKSNTASLAKSSIRYHIRNGFKKAEFNSFKGTSYYSYIFRKQLKPSWFWNNSFLVGLRFKVIYIAVHLLRKPNGEKTVVGQLMHI